MEPPGGSRVSADIGCLEADAPTVSAKTNAGCLTAGEDIPLGVAGEIGEWMGFLGVKTGGATTFGLAKIRDVVKIGPLYSVAIGCYD